MRVISGTLRGRRLSEIQGRNVRPTPDRVREALFSILQSKLGPMSGLNVLDLFAGSGALAIEALSRGAASACLVEKDPQAGQVIAENLERFQLTSRAQLHIRDAFKALPDLKSTFDVIFLDPPYHQGLPEKAASLIDELDILRPGGLLSIETAADESLPNAIGKFIQLDQRRYGSVMIHFYSIDTEGL